jgi:hypothetical protein
LGQAGGGLGLILRESLNGLDACAEPGVTRGDKATQSAIRETTANLAEIHFLWTWVCLSLRSYFRLKRKLTFRERRLKWTT